MIDIIAWIVIAVVIVGSLAFAGWIIGDTKSGNNSDHFDNFGI